MARAELRHGILKAWDAANYLATVQFTGSVQLFVAAVPVSRDIASSDMIAGRKVAVAFFDPSNALDSVVVAVWT